MRGLLAVMLIRVWVCSVVVVAVDGGLLWRRGRWGGRVGCGRGRREGGGEESARGGCGVEGLVLPSSVLCEEDLMRWTGGGEWADVWLKIWRWKRRE